MDIEVLLSSGVASTAVLEGVKWIWRHWVVKNLSYDFPKAFYVLSIPVLNILLMPLAGLIWAKPEMIPSDWIGFVRLVLQTLIMSAISLVAYEGGIKPLKAYRRVK